MIILTFMLGGHHRAQSVNLPPLLKAGQDAFARLSDLTNNLLTNVPVGPEVRELLENLQQSSSAFVQSSKYAQDDTAKDQAKHVRNKSSVSVDWQRLPRLEESSPDSFPPTLLFDRPIRGKEVASWEVCSSLPSTLPPMSTEQCPSSPSSLALASSPLSFVRLGEPGDEASLARSFNPPV